MASCGFFLACSKRQSKKNGQSTTVAINTIELRDNALEFFDATIRKPALKVRLEQVEATVRKLQIAPLAGRTQVMLDAVLKGMNHDGKVVLNGWVELGTKDSDLRTKLRGVDLVALQPYLTKATETGVRKGSLDLDLESTVRQNHLHAPGTVILTGLELSSNGTFMGLPRQAVVGFMKNKKDQIALKFVLDGNLNDPHFSLNESLATRLASATAETFGVNLGGIVSGIGSAGQKSVEGVGNTLKKLFGK